MAVDGELELDLGVAWNLVVAVRRLRIVLRAVKPAVDGLDDLVGEGGPALGDVDISDRLVRRGLGHLRVPGVLLAADPEAVVEVEVAVVLEVDVRLVGDAVQGREAVLAGLARGDAEEVGPGEGLANDDDTREVDVTRLGVHPVVRDHHVVIPLGVVSGPLVRPVAVVRVVWLVDIDANVCGADTGHPELRHVAWPRGSMDCRSRQNEEPAGE